MSSAKDSQLHVDDAVYLWLSQKRGEGMPVSGPLMSKKVKRHALTVNLRNPRNVPLEPRVQGLIIQSHG